MRADTVHEHAVVRHEDQRALEVHEKLFQPLHRFKIEMVRRFVEQKNVAWTIVSGLTDELPDYLPALVTRNGDTAQFATSGQFDSSSKGNDLITLGKKFASPFGDNGLIVVTKSGAVRNFKPRECNLRDVYGRNNLFLPDGIQLKYLEP